MTLFARGLLVAAVLAGVCGAASVKAVAAARSAVVERPSHHLVVGRRSPPLMLLAP